MGFKKKTVWLFVASLFYTLVQMGCSSPSVAPLPTEEVKLARELFLGNQLSKKAEKHFIIKKNATIENYIARLTERLISVTHPGEKANASVFLVNDQQSIWRSFSVPRNRFYISVGLLKTVEYENELAAMLAMQVSLLSRNILVDLIDSLDRSKERERGVGLTWEGVLNHSLKEEYESIAGAIDLLYRAGFDPRGIISLYEKYSLNPDYSPYDKKTQDLYLQSMRQEISKLPPLRNPIVQTEEFKLIQQRITKL